MSREVKIENLFIIGYGLGGGFGGANIFEVHECQDEEDAVNLAYQNCCEYYEGYDGMYGLRDVSMIIEEDEVDEEEAIEIWKNGREMWLEYSAEPYSKELEEKYQYHHWQNDYEHITNQ